MFHKTEEFFPKKTDSDVDDMDTSDTQWGWFYLAECGKWHMFQVPCPELHRPGLTGVLSHAHGNLERTSPFLMGSRVARSLCPPLAVGNSGELRQGACLGDGLRPDLVETGREEWSSVFSTCSGYHVRYFMHPVCPHNSSEVDGASPSSVKDRDSGKWTAYAHSRVSTLECPHRNL